MSNDGGRVARLSKLFENVLRGRQTLTFPSQYSQFLEAFYLQPDPPVCIDKIIASNNAFWSNISVPFLNDSATNALLYLQAPRIKTISSGQFLAKILQAIVEPPIFWDAFVGAFKAKQLSEKGQKCFAWLLLQLILIPSEVVSPYVPLAEELLPRLIASPHLDNTISVASTSAAVIAKDDIRPGGRHDNDFPDFRDIAILPTTDELASTEAPFLRPGTALDDPSTEEHREALYLDNQFRLMREDMIHEMREELQIALGKQKGRRHRGTVVDGMEIIGVSLGDDSRRSKWAIVFKCFADFPELQRIKGLVKRKTFLQKDNHKLLRHQSLTSLLVDGDVLAFPSVRREEDLLAKNPPEIVLEFEGEISVRNFLLKMKTAKHVKLIQIEAAVFSYEPILNTLKRMKVLPLAQELLFWKDGSEGCCLWAKSIILDDAQATSLLSGLKQNVSLIQGPPGIRFLVVCYTNHALDQFLEDLLDIGIPIGHMVRIGGKSTARTEPMLLQKQPCTFRFGRGDYTIIDGLKADILVRATSLPEHFKRYLNSTIRNDALLAYLEFEEPIFYNAFQVPISEDGMNIVGGKGRKVDQFYLLQCWRTGQNAGVFMRSGNVKAATGIWNMSSETRRSHLANWEEAIRKDEIENLYNVAHTYNRLLDELNLKFRERDSFVLRSKRIIGCTTTAAAKYGVAIQSATPDVVLVEEAGEILESHIVTALGTAAKQLILIGDHKQLRPKVNNYRLTVERGEGYDLNKSLFERLVLKGYPHQVLVAQHRMRPEISALIRHLTYPDLIADRRDLGSKSSKQNTYEARMVLKIVKYLAQQGYGTDKMVVLTPYLGQLHKLQHELQEDTDPVLNDLDSYDLIRAGLLTAGAAKSAKRSLRLATIDNYQGEESDIVVVSLTRSNPNNDIGFMCAPERLNVLLSRARNALIMIGNSDTFINAKKGKELWMSLFDLLKGQQHIYDGLPVRCEQHPDRTALLSTEPQFDTLCPDGGCSEPCGAKLRCGLHLCPSKCHQLYDHSQMACHEIIPLRCTPKGHEQSYKCSESPPLVCKKCERDAKAAEARRQKDFERQKKRDEEEAEHLRRIKEIEEQLAEQQQLLQDTRIKEARRNEIRQKMQDLQDAAELVRNFTSRPPSTTPSDSAAGPSAPSNQAIDAIMEMVGLEAVKKQILRIKAKIDVSKRQNIDISKERFNIVLLGNPGTGKTTVARHYVKFLASLQVLPGLVFEETTGSRLANDGVQGAKKLIEGVINAGGGAIFVDEAYQLTGEHNFQGSQVLDFLLAEMENNVGRIVFILAGYNKQMEKFFEHNPGLPSRVPHRLQFEDYKDEELFTRGRLKVEDGVDGLYGRRGRGKEGFGNARALENLVSKITERQAERLDTERRAGHGPDDLLLLKEDLIGPDPSEAIVHSESWTKLKRLIESTQGLYDTIQLNYQRELQEQEPMQSPLNRVFLGSPGTGKTTVAKLYGKILADLGLLSNGEVVTKIPADFVGSALGESEKNTKAILATTVGKVLIIDEAYGLYGGGTTGQQSDPYKTAVIDTIVAEVQSTPGEDRCVLLLGYKQQIVEMFQVRLSRRFAIEDAFYFEDFSTDELREILDLKLKDQNLQATEEAKKVALEVLNRAKIRPKFGNAGDVENLLSKAKANYISRIRGTQLSVDTTFQPADFDPDFDRGSHADDNLDELFKDVVGCDGIVSKLRKYQKTASAGRRKGHDVCDLIPTSFVFKGPPGTGKTTTARKMGQVYFDMGFLSRPDVIECSASDIIGQYVGQTGPQVRNMFDKALGQVLFIDEAYRLKDGVFAKEAIDEIVDLLTQDRIKGKIVVILAGYDEDINELLSVNRGLSSRFPEEIVFQNLRPEECLAILSKQLKKKGVVLPGLDDKTSGIFVQLGEIFEAWSKLPSWGNALLRLNIPRMMIRIWILDPAYAVTCLQEMFAGRQDRSSNLPSVPFNPFGTTPPVQVRDPRTAAAPSMRTKTVTKAKPAEPKPAVKKSGPEGVDGRDPGVSDAVWNQLQMDKAAEIEAAKQLEEDIRKAEEAKAEAARKETEEKERFHQLELAAAREQDFLRQQELKRQREAQRLKELRAREERERREAELQARREAEEKARKEDQKAQAKLREMGVCVAGFRWIKQSDGYCCAGGAHFVSNAELGL
ncbi:P-loop containing nucleoside triphosphate hydrolase protein [Armillaria mellea]|nr:P-loop containing nucleoside triphosphate hydrolase protein [Armillaria mellea]